MFGICILEFGASALCAVWRAFCIMSQRVFANSKPKPHWGVGVGKPSLKWRQLLVKDPKPSDLSMGRMNPD